MKAQETRSSARPAIRVTMAHVLMVVAGLTTFVAVASVLGQRNDQIGVLVAAEPMLAGRSAEAASFDTVMVAADSPLLGQLVAAEQPLAALRLARDLETGDPVFAADLVADDVTGIGRTFTVPVPADVVEGLGLLPGDRLDVIGLTEHNDAEGEAIEVLDFVAVDVEVTRLPGERTGAFAAATANSWVTVAVDHDQAIALAEAQRRGAVELVRATGAEPLQRVGETGGSP